MGSGVVAEAHLEQGQVMQSPGTSPSLSGVCSGQDPPLPAAGLNILSTILSLAKLALHQPWSQEGVRAAPLPRRAQCSPSQAVPLGQAVPFGVGTSQSSPSSWKEPASSQSSELISICLSCNQPEFISNLRFPWMCEAFNKTQSEEMKDLSVCPQRCPLRGQRGTGERKPGLFFMAAA